jgi:hypothetical protein
MSPFIRLTILTLNTKYIHSIVVKPNKYYINMMSTHIGGVFFVLTGVVQSNNYEIVVCEKKNPADYKTVTEWLNKL